MNNKSKEIGERIRSALESKGLKQSYLSRETKIAASTLSEIISGDRSANTEKLSRISKVLDLSLDYLINGKIIETATHTDPALESAVNEHAAGWECKGEEISETEYRVIGMLRRLTPELRQLHFDRITTSYFNQMEQEIEAREKKS